MQSATLLPTNTVPAATVPTAPLPEDIMLIRISIHNIWGEKYYEPSWQILGDLQSYEYERWRRVLREERLDTPFVLGKQDNGDYILDVADLGLNPADCIDYAEAKEHRDRLQNDEYIYDLHADSSCQCLCGEIAAEKAIMDKYEPKITAAVHNRFDAWTRRRPTRSRRP